jgi:hypothetical protein
MLWVGVIAVVVGDLQAKSQQRWTSKDCTSVSCVVEFLNSVNPEVAASAKVIAYDHDRIYLGKAYGIIYKQ